MGRQHTCSSRLNSSMKSKTSIKVSVTMLCNGAKAGMYSGLCSVNIAAWCLETLSSCTYGDMNVPSASATF